MQRSAPAIAPLSGAKAASGKCGLRGHAALRCLSGLKDHFGMGDVTNLADDEKPYEEAHREKGALEQYRMPETA